MGADQWPAVVAPPVAARAPHRARRAAVPLAVHPHRQPGRLGLTAALREFAQDRPNTGSFFVGPRQIGTKLMCSRLSIPLSTGWPLEFASMTVEDSSASGIGTVTGVAAPDLLVVSDAGSTRLRPGSAHRVGRDPQGAIVLGDPRVSWAHGELRSDGGTWVYADPGSTNGTWSGRDQVTRVQIADGCVLRLR